MAAVGKDRQAREARERARLHQARAHDDARRRHRRVRDNVVAGIAGGVLLVALGGAQTGYFLAGPGRPSPAPSATSTATPSATATPSPTPTATP